MQIQYINPFLIISAQGIIGVIVNSVILLIFRNIPCQKNSFLCENQSEDNTVMVEDFLSILKLMFSVNFSVHCYLWI